MIDRLPNNRVVGAKQTIKAIKTSRVREVYIAKDADEKVIEPIVKLCKENDIKMITISSMRKLGSICDIEVGAATACVIE